jgi:hypothetical protein
LPSLARRITLSGPVPPVKRTVAQVLGGALGHDGGKSCSKGAAGNLISSSLIIKTEQQERHRPQRWKFVAQAPPGSKADASGSVQIAFGCKTRVIE